MSKINDTNNKLPKAAPEKVVCDYPYLYQEQTLCGELFSRYNNPEKPNESYTSQFNADGSYKTRQISDQYKGLITALAHEVRKYIGGGSSEQVDGNKDTNTESTSNENVRGEKSSGVGENNYAGAKKNIGGTSQGSFINDTNGTTYKTSKGDVVSSHVGSHYESLEGDNVKAITGNKIDIINEGEHQVHVQGGNMDTRVESGKYKIYSGDEMIITSATKITLKVGSSEIIIDNGEITIKSSAVKFEKV
jgi:uncharacterized Fe-S cluster protein YjdI